MLQCNLKFEEHLDEAKFEALLSRLRAEAEAGGGETAVVEKVMSYAVNKAAAQHTEV
jgi:hypothetical protein